MAPLTYILALLVVLTTLLLGTVVDACPPPPNDFRYADNSTLLAEAAIGAKALHVKRGFTNIGPQGVVTAWPVRPGDNDVRIPFCWYDDNKLAIKRFLFDDAVRTWTRNMGSASAANGHNFGGFTEVMGPNLEFAPCYKPREGGGEIWNDQVPTDALVVRFVEVAPRSPGGSAIAAYIPEDISNRPGRHHLEFEFWEHMTPRDARRILAHELGHVMGLMHEHQRPDRNKYLKFQCENLAGFDKIKNYILHNHLPWPATMRELCTSPALAHMDPWRAFDFAAPSFAITPHDIQKKVPDANGHPTYITVPEPRWLVNDFDRASIMLYESEMGRNQERPLEVSTAVLVFWKGANPSWLPPPRPDNENAELILKGHQAGPSRGDVRTMKYLYPWPH